MSNIRMYCRPQDISQAINITEPDFIHKIKNVLRLGTGDKFCIFDGQGKEYLYSITAITKRRLSGSSLGLVRSQPAARVDIVLAFPVVKENIIDFILQKGTELGMAAFLPFICERSLSDTVTAKRIARWNKVVIEACRQSGRLWLASLAQAVDFPALLASAFECKFVASINGTVLEDNFGENIRKILIAVGPEGDFTQAEYRQLSERGFIPLRLSDNILRTETAAIVAAGLLAQHFC